MPPTGVGSDSAAQAVPRAPSGAVSTIVSATRGSALPGPVVVTGGSILRTPRPIAVHLHSAVHDILPNSLEPRCNFFVVPSVKESWEQDIVSRTLVDETIRFTAGGTRHLTSGPCDPGDDVVS